MRARRIEIARVTRPGNGSGTPLPPEAARIVDEMIRFYEKLRIGTLGHEPASVAKSVSHIRDFIAFTCKAPWDWTGEMYVDWCVAGRDPNRLPKPLGKSTIRDREGAVRRFLGFIEENPKFSVVVNERYGKKVRQIIFEWNSARHVTDAAGEPKRPVIPQAEINRLFTSILAEVDRASFENPKGVMPLKRDYALIYTQYALALRISEVAGLDVDSFFPNQDVPAFADFGMTSVLGKGSNGSGKKRRYVPTTSTSLVEVLKWYLAEVRPHFLQKAAADEKALFLSEQGKRMVVSGIDERFHRALETAHLHDRGYTTHSLRRSGLTHVQTRYSQEYARVAAGHVNLATTQKYTGFPDSYAQAEVARVAARLLEKGEE